MTDGNTFYTNLMTPRRFPPPWSVEDIDACFVVKDHGGQKLAYVYYEDEPGRRSALGTFGKLGGDTTCSKNWTVFAACCAAAFVF